MWRFRFADLLVRMCCLKALLRTNLPPAVFLKGFAAAMLGGLGSFAGAVLGGLALGLLEGLGAGFVSSAYKDAIAFVVILGVLFFMPGGLVGARRSERV